jgi:hypothetical protein
MEMGTSGHLQKLWGRIDENLLKGNYTLEIGNFYNTSLFGGQL